MKSRVDIFRPLAAATRGCRPDSATSIFRRNNTKKICGEADDDDSFVVSVPPGDWPPHETALSSASEGTSPHKPLKTSAPLPAGTTTSSGLSGDDGLTASPLSTSRRTTHVTPRPSYYKIELDPKNEGVVQLTAGDDSSVQFTPEVHNQQLKMTGNENDGENTNGIVRASPVVEQKESVVTHEAIEHDMKSATYETDASERQRRHRSSQQHWTISDSGRIVAVPPSPNRVATAHDYLHKNKSSLIKASSAYPSKPRRYGKDDDLSVPPMLVKANSAGSSSSQSSCGDDDYQTCVSANSLERPEVVEEGAEVISLESPPRMTRSVISQSLFQDSIGSSSRSQSSAEINCVRRMSQVVGQDGGRQARRTSSNCSSGSGGSKCHAGGCGTRPFDFFGTILDVFSLNGPCCRSNESAATPTDSIVCR